jgi:hypothetical protein
MGSIDNVHYGVWSHIIIRYITDPCGWRTQVRFFETVGLFVHRVLYDKLMDLNLQSRMHMMYLIGLETNGAKGGKAMLEGLGVSIILKSIEVKFKVFLPLNYMCNGDLLRHTLCYRAQ